ncbi:MAG: ATP-binding protein [Nitrososphaerota archaeon]|jgi:DNA helicase HerA-like ATPase|nr:ATP-binding protein [Nitrososphaerota archaeon]MDG6972743.1 ATP-binding protein [Nitrososphaerota archaeon]MDG6974028.1 ATP-binding protein [Nitrososphaerota archaeon]MDG6987564.1 ATP-binding protein [Nitrososphaerota archaeon]MDG7026744.1 ATP-binding protein [Nitrososphaerota archaeon]
MGWKLTAFLFLFAAYALGVGALVVGVPILLYLLYRLWSSRQGSPGGKSHRLAYLGAFLLFLSAVAVAEGGTHSPIVFGTAGAALLLLGLFPGAVQELAERAAGAGHEASRAFGETGEPAPWSAVELTTLPLGYLDRKKNDPKETLLRFQRLAQTLGELGFPVEMRLLFSAGSGRILFAAPRGGDGRAETLLRVAKSQLPEFRAEAAEAPPWGEGYSVMVEGVPEAAPDPLGPLAKFFVENRLEGGYAVRISPAWVNPVSRWLAGRRQRSISEKSGYQRVDDDRTTSAVDHPKQVELEHAVRGLERLGARRPVRVSVEVAAPDPATASEAAGVLAGALSSQRRIDGLKVSRPLKGPGRGRPTLMLPSEAAPCLWLPHLSLGMKVAPSAEFQAPPATEGEIVLGESVSISGRSGSQVRVGRDQLAKHVFVTGMTGSGKTTSCRLLLKQLAGLGVPFLVIEPVKSEYRSLLLAVKDLQVFTPGDETAPFRLNIFEPPAGVKVQAHLENLVSVWNSSFVSYAPVPYVVERVFAEAYRACGWSLEGDARGRPVTFDDVGGAVRKVVRGLGYEPRVTMDVEAAISVRLDSLVQGGKKRLFGAPASTPMDAILSKPTVIELKDIQASEEKAFVASLILTDLAERVRARGASKELRHFTLVEEAHRLLPNLSPVKGSPESADPRQVMVEHFGNMLAELRAYGEGLGVVEQIPTKILPDAIKNTATKVVHRLPDRGDRAAMAGAVNASREQSAVLGALGNGEAVVSVEGHPVPVRVEVRDDWGARLRDVTDREVEECMAMFYRQHPLQEQEEPLEERMRERVDSEGFRKQFLPAYQGWARTGKVEGLRGFLLSEAAGLGGAQADEVEAATRVLALATAYYLPFNAEQRERFPRLFRKELEAGVRA